MVGENQCRRDREWTLEPPNRTFYMSSRLWRESHRYMGQILKATGFDIGKVSCFYS
jgi:hypothetical protein